MVPENRFCISAMQTGFVKQTGAFTRDRGAIRFKHDFGTSGSESEAIQYFYCSDFFLTSGSGASPHVRKSGGQETLPRLLSDNKILFEWCCPPVARVYSTCVQFLGLATNIPGAQPTPWTSPLFPCLLEQCGFVLKKPAV